MIHQQLRKAGNSFVITIPKDEVERRGWMIGQRFSVELTLMEERPVMDGEFLAALEEIWERGHSDYQYLADR